MLRLTTLLLLLVLCGFLLVGGFLATGHSGLAGKLAGFLYFVLVFILLFVIYGREHDN